jgi:hypothetical protein
LPRSSCGSALAAHTSSEPGPTRVSGMDDRLGRPRIRGRRNGAPPCDDQMNEHLAGASTHVRRSTPSTSRAQVTDAARMATGSEVYDGVPQPSGPHDVSLPGSWLIRGPVGRHYEVTRACPRRRLHSAVPAPARSPNSAGTPTDHPTARTRGPVAPEWIPDPEPSLPGALAAEVPGLEGDDVPPSRP